MSSAVHSPVLDDDATSPAASAPDTPLSRRDPGRYLDLALAASAGMILWDAVSTGFLLIPMTAFCLVLLVPKVRLHPAPWLIAAALWIPTLVRDWPDHQDHVYVGVYWLLAVGLSLFARDQRAQIELLAHHARWLVGLTFAFAVGWKLTASSYLNGALFRHVLTFDERFEWPFNEIFGRTSHEALEANEAAWLQLQTAVEGPQPVGLIMGSALAWVVAAFVIITLVVEMSLATSFLAPVGSRLHGMRHYVLLGFSWAVYPWVPVTGFALLLMMLGALSAPDRPKLHRIYAWSALGFMVAMAIRVVTL